MVLIVKCMQRTLVSICFRGVYISLFLTTSHNTNAPDLRLCPKLCHYYACLCHVNVFAQEQSIQEVGFFKNNLKNNLRSQFQLSYYANSRH